MSVPLHQLHRLQAAHRELRRATPAPLRLVYRRIRYKRLRLDELRGSLPAYAHADTPAMPEDFCLAAGCDRCRLLGQIARLERSLAADHEDAQRLTREILPRERQHVEQQLHDAWAS